jgi:hypothetical protein
MTLEAQGESWRYIVEAQAKYSALFQRQTEHPIGFHLLGSQFHNCTDYHEPTSISTI